MERSNRAIRALAIALVAASTAVPCLAADTLQSCRSIEDATSRLRCYDGLAGNRADAGMPVRPAESVPPTASKQTENPRQEKSDRGKTKTLVDLWALDRQRLDLTDPMAHRPMYLIGRWTNNVNEHPGNQARGPAAPVPELNPTEAKFQLSFRSELLSPMFFKPLSDKLRLWFAYTQQSNWQVLDTERSRPFRETNYEPEVILTYYNKDHRGEYGPLLANLGFVHQSNGKSDPESRSWNRWYVQGGWDLPVKQEIGSLSVLARGWWSSHKEDNPDIDDYVGRGDLVLRWQPTERHRVSLLARHNLRLNPSRGFMQADWAYDLGEKLPALHVQATSGYGESLIDYNHRQSTFGIGLSFGGW